MLRRDAGSFNWGDHSLGSRYNRLPLSPAGLTVSLSLFRIPSLSSLSMTWSDALVSVSAVIDNSLYIGKYVLVLFHE